MAPLPGLSQALAVSRMTVQKDLAGLVQITKTCYCQSRIISQWFGDLYIKRNGSNNNLKPLNKCLSHPIAKCVDLVMAEELEFISGILRWRTYKWTPHHGEMITGNVRQANISHTDH